MERHYFRVRTPIAPVLKEARASATQENQLLFGHSAEVLGVEGVWMRVRGADSYEGWVHEGFAEPSDAAGWGWEADGEMSMGCTIRDSAGVTIDLPLGAIVREGKCMTGRTLDLARRRELFPSQPDGIVASATGLFQGTYYQWGGITPWGADCSGMVQTIFALHGVRLPRDAWQQAREGVLVDGGIDALKPADLLFFSDRDDRHVTHVAIAISGERLVHLSIGRGGYCVESLDRPDDYVRKLMERFLFARRIL